MTFIWSSSKKKANVQQVLFTWSIHVIWITIILICNSHWIPCHFSIFVCKVEAYMMLLRSQAFFSGFFFHYLVLFDLNIKIFGFEFFSKSFPMNQSHYHSLFHLPVTVTKIGKSKLWMPWEKNSFHSLIRFTGRLPTVSRVVESKKALRSQAKSQLTQANSCTSGIQYNAWFSLVVWKKQ